MVEMTDERDIASAKRYLTRVAQACGDTKEVQEVRPDHPAVEFAREVRIEASKAERDRLRNLSNADAAKIRDTLPERVQVSAGWFQRFATALADALESSHD